MGRTSGRSVPMADQQFRPNQFILWQDIIYRIIPSETPDNRLKLYVVNDDTGEADVLELLELLCPSEDQIAPLFAKTRTELQQKARERKAEPAVVEPQGIRTTLVDKAEYIVNVVEHVQKVLIDREYVAQQSGTTISTKQIIGDICQSLPDSVITTKSKVSFHKKISISTYYNYRNLYLEFRTKKQIAAALQRTTLGKTKMDRGLMYFIDTLILRYYARTPPISGAMLYEIAEACLKRTHGLWIDITKTGGTPPLNIVDELLNEKIPIELILENPEKSNILSPIQLFSRSRLYEYLKYFEDDPERGKKVIINRYGDEVYEHEHLVFDTFVKRATMPLQYVFVDHWLMDVFVVDEETRSKVKRLWLTVLIDAFSRSILGFALLNEAPCIESIQEALLHSIWPKDSHVALGLSGEWVCFGIPQQLFLDNAWAHLSGSLEELARSISQGGMYNSIDLVFRPPYKARYGALIERLFRSIASKVKQLLKGSIQNSTKKSIQTAVEEACLLYGDIYKFVHELIITYQHTPHSELGGLTPHEKWVQGLTNIDVTQVPPLTEDIKRLFWRLHHDTRKITSKGIGAFGMHYKTHRLHRAPVVAPNGRKCEYNLRYQVSDISRLALFLNGRWVGDVQAKELLLADGSTLRVSLAERELAQDLARSKRKAVQDWLKFVNDINQLNETRTDEKKKVRRKRNESNSSQRPINSTNTANVDHMNRSPTEQMDYTAILKRFVS